MYVVYVETEDLSDGNDVWERWKRHEGEMMREQPGWLKRILLRSHEHPRRYHYISFWKTEEEAAAFSNTDAFKKASAELGVVGSVTRHRFERCDLLLDEAHP
jgi:heme-degrading monooxygenase HmoA